MKKKLNQNVLIKPTLEPTSFILPVLIITNSGYVKKERYYECEYLLFKAYRQLKKINGVMQPLDPIIRY